MLRDGVESRDIAKGYCVLAESSAFEIEVTLPAACYGAQFLCRATRVRGVQQALACVRATDTTGSGTRCEGGLRRVTAPAADT